MVRGEDGIVGLDVYHVLGTVQDTGVIEMMRATSLISGRL